MARPTDKNLREGFTTGSAATGAALAALHLLCTGRTPARVRVPLPPLTAGQGPESFMNEQPRAWRTLPVAVCGPGLAPEVLRSREATAAPPASGTENGTEQTEQQPADVVQKLCAELCRHWQLPATDCTELCAAHASIRKDGGDDPDATSGALITASVFFCPGSAAVAPEHEHFLCLDGGPGVGRATLPGLPIAVGEAAINPVPRRQLRFALGRYAARSAQGCPPLAVIISVPEGERIAAHTFNPRLGITGGISILGTQGTVRPFSHKAWKATIEQGLQVALATGSSTVCLSTGRRSEKLLMAKFPHLPERCFVQAADFAQFSLKAAGALPLERLVWGCFFGKLVKLAQGHPYTHARDADLDMAALAALCRQKGAACAAAVADCITAAHALELLLSDPAGQSVLEAVTARAAAVASGFAGRPVDVYLFHIDGRELVAS